MLLELGLALGLSVVSHKLKPDGQTLVNTHACQGVPLEKRVRDTVGIMVR